MNHIRLLTMAAATVALCACGRSDAPRISDSRIVKVGIFSGHGGAETCKWETFEAVKIDTQMRPYFISSADISLSCLDTLDAIIIPGGGGSTQYLNLGLQNMQKIKEFILKGGGAVGICAGAYLFSNTEGYSCMKINGARAIDIEHDNRGHGLAKFTLEDAGKALFPELADLDTAYTVYYEGPVLVSADDTLRYEVFATMQSDVHEEGGAPRNMTNNRPLFIGNSYGKGRVFSSIAHPEGTPGMRWLIPAMVRWTLRLERISYNPRFVRPDLHSREILFTKDMLKKERSCFKTFLYGAPEEKVAALGWLQDNLSWDGKRWLQGLLYDDAPTVRARAAQYIAHTEYSHYLPDLKAALGNEQDSTAKAAMREAIEFLQAH